jgi:hypothetical protein
MDPQNLLEMTGDNFQRMVNQNGYENTSPRNYLAIPSKP